MKSTRTAKIILAAALAAGSLSTTHSGIGDFFNRVGKSVDVAVGNATPLEKIEYDRDSIVRKLSDACEDLELSKSRAYIAVGDAENAAKAKVSANAVDSEKSLKVLDEYLKNQEKDCARDIVKDGTVQYDDARKEIMTSMKHVADALRAERLLLPDVKAAAAAAEAMLKGLTGEEKKAAEEKIGFLAEFGKTYPARVEATKNMLNSYIEAARKKGIDTISITKKLTDILSE